MPACSVSKSGPTLCDPMDCSSPDSSVPGISQARIPEWVAIPFSMESFSNPGIEPLSPALAGRFFTIELPGKPFQTTTVPKSKIRYTGTEKKVRNLDSFFYL